MTNTLMQPTIAAESASGLDALGIDPILLLVQTGVFVLLFFVVRRFALGPISKTLNDRQQRIEEGLEFADQAEQRTKQVNQETERLMKDARVESAAIVSNAKKEAEQIAADSEAKMKAKADKIMKEADESIKSQIAAAEESLKSDVAKYVRQASEIVVGEKLDSKSDADLIGRAIADARASKGGKS